MVVPSSSSQPSISHDVPGRASGLPTTSADPRPGGDMETHNDIGCQNQIDTGAPSTEPSNSTQAVSLPQSQSSLGNTDQTLRYPSNAVRQRKSNVATLEPEIEFQRATIDACRSTITQQESEIKRLNENLDLRNKKIMQLESQVGSAASYLSSRDTGHQSSVPANISDQLTALLTTMNLLISKLSLCLDSTTASKTSPINIFNSPSQTSKMTLVEKDTQTKRFSITTEDTVMPTISRHGVEDETEAVLSCTVCGKVLETSEQLDLHIDNCHSRGSGSTGNKICDYCDEGFPTYQLLQQHHSAKHATSYIKCGSCMQRFQDRTQLDIHMKATHASSTDMTSARQVRTDNCPRSLVTKSMRSSSVSSVQSSKTSNQENL